MFWAALSSPQYRSIYSFKKLLTPEDSTTRTKSRRPTYQTEDRVGDQYNNKTNKSPLELQNPDNITEEVEIDTATGNYIVREKVGDMDYRTQTYMTFEEYYNYKNKQMLRNYWRNRGDTAVDAPRGAAKPGQPFGFTKHIKGLEGPFGSNYVDIRPSGLVTLDFAGRFQRVNNPSLPIKQQKTGLFDFDQQISMNVIGKVGEKLKLTVNWDTKAAFEFQNSVKIQYTAFEEDIIQAIEVGRVNMPLQSSLMTGPQNLFGIKTKLQFGRLSVTAVAARQDGKLDEIKIGGGGQGRTFEIKADGYEPYRHFFLSQFFRANYEKSLKSIPTILSGVQIKRVDVYITNRNNTTANLRSVVGYLDLGESDSLYRDGLADPPPFGPKVPYNGINKLYTSSDSVTKYRNAQTLDQDLANMSIQCGCDFQNGTDYTYLKSARKLLPTEFTFNADLGYITLMSRLNEDEALLVAYQYTYNNESYTVGELTDDLTKVNENELIIAKMIKPPVIKTHLPTWDLMMKNIYQLGVTQIQRDNFQFKIIYKDDATGLDIPNLQQGAKTKDVPLLQLCGLDYLNPNNDPAPDGNFDYVEGITVDSRNGRIIFPVLEPFGSNLDSKFLATETDLKQKYVFNELYDSTASDASQVASKNKYFFKGRYTAGTASEIMLPGINVAQGSVVVIAGSTTLVEGKDYTVDYSLGRIKILDNSILASGQEIRIRFEKQDLFNFRRKSFLGTRFDYKVNDKILLGATMLHSNEAPNITRVNIGDEPAANTIWGFDANIKSSSRLLTRAVDFLPVVSTKAPSNISFQGEFAQFIPGYNKILDKNGNDEKGIAFIDDFEGAKTPYDLTRSPITWTMSATPQRIDEADSTGLINGYHRARLAWYNIDNIFYRSNNGLPAYLDYTNITNHFERNITQLELFPNQDLNVAVTNIPTLDLAFYPEERGAYNFTDDVSSDGKLNNPRASWGGITKAIKNNIDFDNANIQYIEFWLLSPFIDGANGHTKIDGVPFDPNNTGYLYFNLGSISEDVLPDNLQSFENGLPVDDSNTGTTETTWGLITTQQYITNAFDNNPSSRPFQDIGLDGLNDDKEKTKFAARAAAIKAKVTPSVYAGIENDLCSDNFQYYLGSDQDTKELTILQRYKHFNLTQNNSPINNGTTITPSSSSYPDNEDLNQDNNLNTIEEYYEYKIKIDSSEFQVGKNYIVSSRTLTITASDGSGNDQVTWYQFRVPIRTPDSIVGGIQGYKSIKWMRTYVTGFKSPVVLRLAQFQLVANQWRPYNLPDLQQGPNLAPRTDESVIDLSVVNVEENSSSNGNTTPYVLPPDFGRDYDATSVTTRRTNEQSLRLCIDGLQDGSIRAAYKNVNLNLMNYTKIEMFIHAESNDDKNTIHDSTDAYAILRLGTDYTNNYYEIQVPLYFTTPITSTDPYVVWRSQNEISVNITDLVNAKVARNSSGASLQSAYSTGKLPNGNIIVVVGNPDLSAVVTLMLGVKNPIGSNANPMKFCIWADELRATGFNSHSSIAYAATLSANLADLGTLNGSIRYTSAGFGSLDQKVSQRERANTLEYGLNTKLEMDKFIPGKTGIKLPMYVGFNRKVISPEYDPLNPDVSINQSVNSQADPQEYRKLIVDQTMTKAINFTGIQKVKVKPTSKKHVYDVENLMLSAGYTQTKQTSYELKNMEYEKYNGTLAYNFSNAAKSYTPLKSMKATKGPLAPLMKDFNFALMPSQMSFKADLTRELRTTQYYQSNPLEGLVQDPLYAKSFTFKRNYSLMWNFTKSITGTYRADADALIDEPNRAPGGKEYSDSLKSNLMKMGRLKAFNQTYTLTYRVPLDKIKMLNWTSMDYTYGAGYTWTAGALGQRDTLGNTISNKQDNSINGKLDLDKLYSKSKFLMEMKKPKPPLKKPDPKDTIPPPPNRTLLKAAFKTLMMIRNANITYTRAQSTFIAGFMETPKYLGFTDNQNIGTMAPFVFGSQNANFRTDAAGKGWISTAPSLNTLYMQKSTQDIIARMNIEPIKDFKVVLEAKYSKGNTYTERFRSFDGTKEGFISEKPLLIGTYSISTITILTAFDKHISGSKDPNSSKNFQNYTEYRDIMLDRLGATPSDSSYTGNSQAVLLPSFLAAYSGKDPNKINISGIPKIPLPGWQIDYTGLARSKALARKFSSITISHKYSSQYFVGSFTSQSIYNANVVTPTSNFYDTNIIPTEKNSSGQLVPIYVMTGVMITEAFAPFIGINARTKNKVSYRVTYSRTRILNMSLSNAQLTESYNNSWQVGIGFARSNLPIPKFLTGGAKKFLKNELNIQVNFTINDMITYQRKFLENATVTSGNTNIQFKPTVSYNMSQRVTMMLYFERTINSPKISSSYRRATTAIGVQIRFTLS
ncbi:cell surface protein SprA [Cytophaga aurantiaca]|uniref:T9SS outer membrane translocon Sov/SprA n=1 Tax=Cytophaga aurantiaca TaxID=29530 RepID=UPI00035FAA40|nr:cell surface protein SprA [Cytophaga aurantiaca]